MPRRVENKLQREAAKKFPGDRERQGAYVFGALRRQGWKPHGGKPCGCGDHKETSE